jgi:hypothetical protein
MLVRSAVRTVANLFWVLYFKLLPSVGLLYAAFIPKAGEVKLDDRDWVRARKLAPALSTTSFPIHPIAWKGHSTNFALTAFSEVRQR